ncbi:MAG: class II fructose-bisphosphate aldolase [Lachnospiraceae bacterium]|nr:class II fructose-bisphosphate aldolase [Lachnospiraceae bacterium]
MLVNMKQMLEKAKTEKYGVGFFNAVNLEMARAVIETAEEMKAPVIVGTAEVLLGATDLKDVAKYLIPMAKEASVPVCVHYDHGLTFERCMEALRLGFTSIMYDCSVLSYKDNLKKVKEMVDICHAMGVTVEGELGHVGDNAGSGKLENPSDYYTSPDLAYEFVRETKVDALAVAVGNAHGDYAFPPKLDFDRISEISQKTGIPLVLHGGSGLSDDDFKTAVKLGISKINIFTDIDKAGKAGIEKGLAEGAKTMMALIPYETEAMKNVVREKINLFGSENRA